ncbi:hypothetical protein ACFQXB_12710 [Plastorhodobacter daqingensis]|uniref:Uncharacterized protein n=1 Tax=Plastorhodobacter daqingensis TaxID=1387281 RepID=A0ABW2UP23_9RHOB
MTLHADVSQTPRRPRGLIAVAGAGMRRLLGRPLPAPASPTPPAWQLVTDGAKPGGLSDDAQVRLLVVNGNDYAGHYVSGRAGCLDWTSAYAWIRVPAPH